MADPDTTPTPEPESAAPADESPEVEPEAEPAPQPEPEEPSAAAAAGEEAATDGLSADADGELDSEDAATLAESLLAEMSGKVQSAAQAAGAVDADEDDQHRVMGEVVGHAGGGAGIELPSFESFSASTQPAKLDLLADVNLNVKIELGRTRMLVDDVLKLGEGAVVELDKLAGDPVDIFVNERHVARGEVLVLNDSFCVRISEIVDPDERKAG